MKCKFCGKETMNKVNNKPLCKKHILEARKLRDEHNEKVTATLLEKGKGGVKAPVATRFVKNDPLIDLSKVTTGYFVDKLFIESLEKKDV